MDVYQRRRLVALSAIAAVFVVIVLLIRSCGGDDEETPTAPLAGATGLGGATSQSQAGYIDQADAICLEANTLIADIDSAEPLAAAAEEAQAVEGELQQLQTLLPPDEGEEDLDKFLSQLGKLYELLQDQVTATEREDDAAIADLDAEIEEAERKVARAAEDFGFDTCGNPEAVGESTSGGEETDTDTETDTGGTEATAPPATTTPTVTTPPTTPPADTGTEGGVGTAPPPADTGTDTGGTDSSSGGVSP